MTLRWRLTLFYTALLAFLLTGVGVITLYMMRVNLIGGIDTELQNTYKQFVTYLVRPIGAADETARLPTDQQQLRAQRLQAEQFSEQSSLVSQIGQAKLLARYYFPNSSVAVEDLSFYTRQTLIDDLKVARTAQEKRELFAYLAGLRGTSRRSLAVDIQRPITLTDRELEALINATDGRLHLNRLIADAPNREPTLMRLLVVLGPLTNSEPRREVGLSGFESEPPLGIVYVARSLGTVQKTLDDLRQVVMLLFLTGLATAGTGAYLLAGQALLPLRRVQRAAERIGGQNLTERVPVPQTGDEVESLATALNAMLGRLEGSFEAQRRFTSDASHELRTPVTAISGHASYLLRRTNPTGQQQESLKIIQSESERLTNLIASLLQLARSDSGALTLQRGPVFSALLLSDIVRELAPLAQAQHTTLTSTGEDVTFEGDADRLKQVLINLVSNALKAGAQTVTLRSERVGAGVRLSVQDDGPGIPEDQLERLFDRFYRLEDSRSRDQGGAGLGLSIARGIVDAHGGRIWLDSEVGQGTTAHVQLPVGNVPELDLDDVP
ncbi:signal transduction histidine kinase [Deinococcus soli (ex Cha et al. 2016)]|uniref:histidine kinase n=3 Tax=Deinococcus soli (ex Cha et al. 2016) TaxID=1309411 RepID=A0AAE3XC21_9DEIO|nr:HAMP domain-containing sensor histidine kinase [Deinococcus soli (ex Cha et al. 2016)]MDR6219060.1 signal transduction histidine kinase [Deinococcus soli (ex Cha et al. 2016)]MDR6329309.1 signal transduction histidine kinase [Deinococcus soli (ex Cha et al. 2016)]MDR6751969.1 signal transduction histidine kinase [Deinococcus soli (ex Cha et al. 2016)]